MMFSASSQYNRPDILNIWTCYLDINVFQTFSNLLVYFGLYKYRLCFKFIISWNILIITLRRELQIYTLQAS